MPALHRARRARLVAALALTLVIAERHCGD